MTTEKMPDVIWASDLGGWVTRQRDPNHGKLFPKYLRAEPVEELLRQARDALIDDKYKLWDDLKKYITHDEFKSLFAIIKISNAITAIDKFLGDK